MTGKCIISRLAKTRISSLLEYRTNFAVAPEVQTFTIRHAFSQHLPIGLLGRHASGRVSRPRG